MCSPCRVPPTAERLQTGRCPRPAPPDCMRRPPAGPQQAYCPLSGRISGEFSLSLRRCSSTPMDFPSSPAKSSCEASGSIMGSCSGTGAGLAGSTGSARRQSRSLNPALFSPRMICCTCIVEIVGGSQHIGHIQGLCPVLYSIGQAQNTPQNLLHIHLTGFVGKGSQNIGKGTVPALFQRVYRDDVPHRTVRGQQVHIFQLIHIGGADGNVFGGNTQRPPIPPAAFQRWSRPPCPSAGLGTGRWDGYTFRRSDTAAAAISSSLSRRSIVSISTSAWLSRL